MGKRAFGLVALVLAVACGDNIEPPEDPDQVLVLSLETYAPAQVAAGDTINVTCTLFENDVTTMVPATIRVVSEDNVVRMGDAVVARKVGMIEVACTLPERGIFDPSPSAVEIVAGPPANVVTSVTPDPVIAGNNITATCTVYDGYGNLITDQNPTLALAPTDAANTVSGLTATMIRAGHYIATCELPGTTSNNDGFDVLPNLPASIAISKVPDLQVYAINDDIEIVHVVTDRYGNEITDAVVTKTSSPITGVGPTMSIPPQSFRYGGEGRYLITATVEPPTDGSVPVSASLEVLINSRGPAIVCNNDAGMLNLIPPANMTITGNVADVNGVDTLTINGTPVTIAADGSFSRALPTRFGMNFVDVTATDSFGEPTTKVCTYLVSPRYASVSTPISDTISLKLMQSAVDDVSRSGLPSASAVGSFGDILHLIVNSQGLRDAVHTALWNANPLKPRSCDSQSCGFWGCICWYSSEVRYVRSQFDGPHTVNLSLVDGGIRAVARFDNVHVRLRVRGDVGPIPYDTEGWVHVQYVQVQLTLDTAISNGRPHVTVRAGSVSSDVGLITTEFNGVDGWIINNIVVPLAQNQIRNALRSVITNFVTNNFNTVLDGLMSNLNINTLGATFNAPKLGGGSVPLSFGVGFSSLSATPSRILFGIGSRFTAPVANTFPSLGVALPSGTNLLDPSLANPPNTGVGAHVGIFNGALHALWKANYFDADIAGTLLGNNVPSTTMINMLTRLPPVAYISNAGIVQLHIGAVDLLINHPDLPPNLTVRLGAEAHANVTLNGNDLNFGGLVIDALHLSTEGINLDSAQQQDLQQTMVPLVQQLIDQSLNDSLPALPIPGFTIPASLGPFGLPIGRQLGINSPTLSIAPQHFTLRGNFGIRP